MVGVWVTVGVANGIAKANGFRARGGSTLLVPLPLEDGLKLSRRCFMLRLREFSSRLSLRRCFGE